MVRTFLATLLFLPRRDCGTDLVYHSRHLRNADILELHLLHCRSQLWRDRGISVSQRLMPVETGYNIFRHWPDHFGIRHPWCY